VGVKDIVTMVLEPYKKRSDGESVYQKIVKNRMTSLMDNPNPIINASVNFVLQHSLINKPWRARCRICPRPIFWGRWSSPAWQSRRTPPRRVLDRNNLQQQGFHADGKKCGRPAQK
jgi:hypothetical protein